MFIDKNSIKIGTSTNSLTDISGMLVEAKYQYNKLWSSDSGRNLAGKQSGTLIGIFPKVILQFRKLTKNEFETIRPILDASKQYIRYYDPKNGYTTMQTYTGDYEITNKSIVGTRTYNVNGTTITTNVKNEGFQISFISVSKR